MSSEAQRWVDHYRSEAELGNPDAQIALAWEYVRGDYLQKDIEQAKVWFQKAELTHPYIARFNLQKALFHCGMDVNIAALETDGAADFSPAYYLAGMALRRKNPREAVRLFCLAGSHGHLIGKFLCWRFSKLGFSNRARTVPGAIKLLLQIAKLMYREPNNKNILS